jgi:hypothetical protein
MRYYVIHGSRQPVRRLVFDGLPDILQADGSWTPAPDTSQFEHRITKVSQEEFDCAVAEWLALPDLPDPAGSLARQINIAQEQRLSALRDGLLNARAVGQLLLRAEEEIGERKWLRWIEENCRINEPDAQLYLKMARLWAHLEGSGAAIDSILREAGSLIGAEDPQELKTLESDMQQFSSGAAAACRIANDPVGHFLATQHAGAGDLQGFVRCLELYQREVKEVLGPLCHFLAGRLMEREEARHK